MIVGVSGVWSRDYMAFVVRCLGLSSRALRRAGPLRGVLLARPSIQATRSLVHVPVDDIVSGLTDDQMQVWSNE